MTPPASPTSLLEDSYDDNDDPETKQPQEMQSEEIKNAMAEKFKTPGGSRRGPDEQVQFVRAFVSQHCHLSRSPNLLMLFITCESALPLVFDLQVQYTSALIRGNY